MIWIFLVSIIGAVVWVSLELTSELVLVAIKVSEAVLVLRV